MELTKEIEMIELDGGCAYLIHTESKNYLIDTGLPKNEEEILNKLKKVLGDNTLDAILLTHHDVDHVGNLKAVQQKFGGKAYIHPLDLPYASSMRNRPGVKHVIEKLIKPAVSEDIYTFNEFNDSEIEIIHTPGHTPGHCIIKYKDYLFTGDLFKYLDNQIVCMKKKMNYDNSKMAKSINLLLKTDAKYLCPAHTDKAKAIEFSEKIKNELRKAGEEYGKD